MTRFPWRRAMELGLGMLALTPAAFWAMTLRELEAALAGAGVAGPAAAPARDDLARLMRRYPDPDPLEDDDGR